ncbi:MAG: hypothetical protein KG075_09480 [Alphaproteobacteria bacterium]|nr:hypothetical protein [Alphaproteobacteria bacterium]
MNAFQIYAEGGTIKRAVGEQKISNLQFYQGLDAHQDLKALYYQIQAYRADMMADEAYELSTDTSITPQQARERASIRLKIAGLYDRSRFGEKVDITMTGQVDITAALLEARNRSGRPVSDLVSTAVPQVLDVLALPVREATDKETVAPPNEAAFQMQSPFDD